MFEYEKLKRCVEESGIKQKFIAERVGLAEATFSLILAGKRKCNVDEYVKICIAVNKPFSEFITQDEAVLIVKGA